MAVTGTFGHTKPEVSLDQRKKLKVKLNTLDISLLRENLTIKAPR